jgi:hypothetical protein
MTLIDNQKGGLNLNANGESDSTIVRASDIFIYGEGENMGDDCPENHNCYCEPKMGLMLFGSH